MRPSSPIFATISYGNRFSRSSSSATGRTSFRAKSRTVSRRSLCSSLSSKSTASSLREASELEALHLQQLLDGEPAVLAAVAGLLVAAERGHRVEGAAVDLDLAGADAAGDADRAVLVGRPDAAGEAVVAVVGDTDSVLLVLVGLDREDRPEDLLLGDRHLGAHL